MGKEVNEEMLKQLRAEAEKLGLDPALVKIDDVDVSKQGDKIRVKWGDVEVETPGPSSDGIDIWLAENGKVIAGAVIALAAVTIGFIGAAAMKR